MEGYETVDGIGRCPQQNLRGFVTLVIIAQILGLAAVVVTAVWMGSLWGGFSWNPDLVFNYHPLFMVIGMIFLYADGILAYRIFRNNRKLPVKILHAVMHILALIFASVGLRAVFYAHGSNGIANLYSLHSWLGLSAVVLFGLQWIVGFISFLFPKLPEGMRAALMPLHKVMGLLIFGGALASALMGITEKNAFAPNKYSELSGRDLLSNFLGIILVLFGAVVVYIVTKEDYRRIDPVDEERIVLND